MKERFSNVLAWFGLLYPAISWVSILAHFMGYEALKDVIHETALRNEPSYFLFITFGLYPCCAVVNYLMVGRLRLLPWVKK